jgi:hypothetical protein
MNGFGCKYCLVTKWDCIVFQKMLLSVLNPPRGRPPGAAAFIAFYNANTSTRIIPRHYHQHYLHTKSLPNSDA